MDKKAVGLKFLGMKIRILSQDSAFLMWRLNPRGGYLRPKMGMVLA